MGLVLVFTLVKAAGLWAQLLASVLPSAAVVNQKGPIMGSAAGMLLGFFVLISIWTGTGSVLFLLFFLLASKRKVGKRKRA